VSHVLDASALLAYAHNEPGGAWVAAVIEAAYLSTVNLSEAVAKFVERGTDYGRLQNEIRFSGVTLVPFEAADAYAAGDLRRTTRRFGLSFGDRACLTLARRLGFPVLTTDRAWAKLDIGVAVEVIR
jgi:PIN domain nuclease of toxin-antitoxin system